MVTCISKIPRCSPSTLPGQQINALMQPLLNKKLRCRHLNASRRVMYDEIMVNKSVDSAHFQAGQMTADVLLKPVYGAQFFKFAASILGGGSHTQS